MSTAKLNHNNADRSLHAENCKCPLRVKGCLEEKLKELISVAKKKKIRLLNSWQKTPSVPRL